MKLSILFTAAVLPIVSLNALSSQVIFKPKGDNLATQACVVAATKGIEAANTLVADNDIDAKLFARTVTCNGVSLSKFAAKYAQAPEQAEEVQTTRVVKLVAKTQNAESQLCLDAVTMGETKARAKHAIPNGLIICNNLELSRFVRNFQNKDIVIANAED